jgi:hypothetical protein
MSHVSNLRHPLPARAGRDVLGTDALQSPMLGQSRGSRRLRRPSGTNSVRERWDNLEGIRGRPGMAMNPTLDPNAPARAGTGQDDIVSPHA